MEAERGTIVSVEEHVSELTEHLYQLQQNNVLCDITLKADNGVVRAHSVVLSAVSPYFKRIVTNTCVCNPDVSISMKGFDVEYLKNVLLYIYTGKIFISASNVNKMTSLLKQIEMPSVIKMIAKNCPDESHNVRGNFSDGRLKENSLSGDKDTKPLIISPWSERLRHALKESNNTNCVQESKEKLSNVYDILRKSAESLSDGISVNEKPVEGRCMVDINDSVGIARKEPKPVSVDINNCDSEKMFNAKKRKGFTITNSPVEKTVKLDKHTSNGVLNEHEEDLLNSFINKIKEEPQFNQYEDPDIESSSCGGSDIFNELLGGKDAKNSEQEYKPVSLCGPENMEVVSGIQKSLDFITNNENRLQFSKNKDYLFMENEGHEEQHNQHKEIVSDDLSELRGKVSDDSVSNTSEDIGLLRVALSRGYLKQTSTLSTEVSVKPMSSLSEHNVSLTSPMSEMSANYTSPFSEASLSQSPMLSDTSVHQVPMMSDVNITRVPASPELSNSQTTQLSESSVYQDHMLSDANIERKTEQKSKNMHSHKHETNCSTCRIDFTDKESFMEHQRKHHPDANMLWQERQDPKIERAEGLKPESVRSSVVSPLGLLNTSDAMENESQCNLDSSYNFSISSEILNNFQQNQNGEIHNSEIPAVTSVHSTDLSGHQIVEHFENIDQLEMTPELLEAVVNPDFVQQFDNETVVSINQPEIILQPQGSDLQEAGQIILQTYDSDPTQSGHIIIQTQDGDLNQSEQIIIQSHDGTHDNNPNCSEHIIIQSHDGTHDNNPNHSEQIIIQSHDGNIIQSGQVLDNIFERMENYTLVSQNASHESTGIVKNFQSSIDDKCDNGPTSAAENFKHPGIKKITRCRTCGIDFQNERIFKLHRKREHPIAHMTWLRRTEKRKQIEALLAKVEILKKGKDLGQFQELDPETQGNSEDLLKQYWNRTVDELDAHMSRDDDDDDDDDDEIYDPSYNLPSKQDINKKLAKSKGITRCRTCKIEFHHEARFRKHRAEMHPIAHMTWVKRHELRQQLNKLHAEKFKYVENTENVQTSNALDNQLPSTSCDSQDVSDSDPDENEEAGHVLGEIIERMDQPDDERGDNDNPSDGDDDSVNELSRKLFSTPVTITGRIRRVTYCRTCAITFENTDAYRAHREKVHPAAHKYWLARNQARQKITSLIQSKSKKSGKTCHVCGLNFPTYVLLKRHQALKHSDFNRREKRASYIGKRRLRTRNRCFICKHVCPDQQSLFEHKETYHPLINGGPERKEVLECEKCDFTAQEMHSLIQHKNQQHLEELEVPEDTIYSSHDEDQIQTKGSSPDIDIISCMLCNFMANDERDVLRHVQSVHNKNPISGYNSKQRHRCTQCEYTASNSSQLNAHMIKHSEASVSKRLRYSNHDNDSINDKDLSCNVQAGVVEYNNRLLYLGILGDDMESFTFCRQPVGKLKGRSYFLEFTDQSLNVNFKDQLIINNQDIVTYFKCKLEDNSLVVSAYMKQKIENDIIQYAL